MALELGIIGVTVEGDSQAADHIQVETYRVGKDSEQTLGLEGPHRFTVFERDCPIETHSNLPLRQEQNQFKLVSRSPMACP